MPRRNPSVTQNRSRTSGRLKDSKAAKPRRFPKFKSLLLLLVAIALLPVAQVSCVQFVDPPTTPEMLRFEWFSDDEAALARGLRYEWIPLAEIPVDQIHYIWASEDQRFFDHGGIDWDEIRLALEEAEESGGPPRGASTISQQCARSLFLWQGRSWFRKGLETLYTVLMETLLPKTRILELYLNVIEFGPGIYGVQAASKTFFGRPPSDLTHGQMALLAAVLPNPKGWNPANPSPRLLQRQRRVIRLASNSRFPTRELVSPDQ